MQCIPRRKKDFTLTKSGVLYREVDGGETISMPKSMQWDIIIQTHEQGHFGSAKTMMILQMDYWFPNMGDKIKKAIDNCIQYVLAEKKQGKSEGLLNPIEKKTIPLDTYHIYHLGLMLSTRSPITTFS